MTSNKSLTQHEVVELMEQYRNGDKYAKEKLYKSIERFVRCKASDFVRRYAQAIRLSSSEPADYYQAAAMGTWTAIDTYDPGLASFMTYANIHITRACMETLRDAQPIVPSTSAWKDNATANKYKTITSISGTEEYHNLIVKAISTFDPECVSDEVELLRAAMAELPTRSQEIVRKAVLENRTFEDIGSDYDLSRQRVHKILQTSLKKLRKLLSTLENEDES